MPKPIRDGGPAFPIVTETAVGAIGMTLRDYFAGQALAGICSANDTWPRLEDGDYVSKLVYALADAMLAAREVASDDA